MGQVLLTGSSNIFSSAEVMDSLAGRVQTLVLHPMSAAEIYREAPIALLDWAQHSADLTTLPSLPVFTRSEAIDLITTGGYPEIRLLGERARQRRYRGYIDSIVDRDVAAGDPTAVARLRTWHRFAHPDRLAWAFSAERDPARRKRLADAYRELTGQEVEWRLSVLND